MSMQLVPEIEASLREEATARGLSVDQLIQEALALYRKESPMPVRSGYLERHREMAWAQKPDMAVPRRMGCPRGGNGFSPWSRWQSCLQSSASPGN